MAARRGGVGPGHPPADVAVVAPAFQALVADLHMGPVELGGDLLAGPAVGTHRTIRPVQPGHLVSNAVGRGRHHLEHEPTVRVRAVRPKTISYNGGFPGA